MGASITENDVDDDSDFAESHEINVTPFIDVILVLLIIFMVAAPLSTVDSGAATIKMIKSTRMTSMNGVTLISWDSSKSLSSSRSVFAIDALIAYSAAARECEPP